MSERRGAASPLRQTSIIHGFVVDEYILIDVVGSHADFKYPEVTRLSVPAPSAPYQQLPEPKNGVAFDRGMEERHENIKTMINAALLFLKNDYTGKYCLERRVIGGAESAAMGDQGTTTDGNTAAAAVGGSGGVWFDAIPPEIRDLKRICEPLKMALRFSPHMGGFYPFVLENQTSIQGASLADIYGNLVVNRTAEWKTMGITEASPTMEVTKYDIPPRSSFLLAPFSECFDVFNTYCCKLGGFDFILMDPPWPNRSASRSSAYDSFNMYELFKLREKHIAQDGILGVWVTNKTKYFNFVVNKLFPSLGMSLVAKWIWVKVTSEGDPMFDLQAVSRKPYEILLLGRRLRSENKEWSPEMPLPLADKVLVGVPEIHSRKPCLRELIMPYLPIQTEARVCEIFARNLVRGWFSFGDEVLIGNWVDR